MRPPRVDEVGRGATEMLRADPDRHVWGLGRHFVGLYAWGPPPPPSFLAPEDLASVGHTSAASQAASPAWSASEHSRNPSSART